ncbi:hypothetical protein MMC21_005986 [Puttea exsequens]|nr:hypothetical protein [Puttea exsequens]
MASTKVSSLLKRIAEEFGIFSILHSSRDTKLLCLQRFVRLFAYGASTLILVLYLSNLGSSDARIGLFMTLTLLGDVVISFLLTLVADGLGRRRILMLGAILMSASGVVFAMSGNFWVLVAASIFGVISPSGNEIGPFRAIEESTLAQLTPKEIRSDIFAWYTLLGTAGTALGTIMCGWLVQALLSHAHWAEIKAYRLIFCIYAVLGIMKLLLSLMLSEACEPEAPKREYEEVVQMEEVEVEAEGLLSDSDFEDPRRPTRVNEAPKPHLAAPLPKKIRKSIWPSISPQSRTTLLKLSLLFSIDSFASGLVPLSWLTYFFHLKFALPSGALGTLFFVTNILASLSGLLASSLAKRIGLLKTMVYTHLPSALFLALIPLPPPRHAALAILFLLLRSSLQSMDQAPRQAFIAAAVLPGERTAVMGLVNVVKTLSQSGGPVATGAMAGRGKWGVAFLVAGGLKAGYDLAMLGMFLGFRGREEEEEEKGKQRVVGRGESVHA